MVEAEFVLGGLKAVLDRPAAAFHGNQGLERRTERAPSREEGRGSVRDGAPDQEPSRPRVRRPIELVASRSASSR